MEHLRLQSRQSEVLSTHKTLEREEKGIQWNIKAKQLLFFAWYNSPIVDWGV